MGIHGSPWNGLRVSPSQRDKRVWCVLEDLAESSVQKPLPKVFTSISIAVSTLSTDSLAFSTLGLPEAQRKVVVRAALFGA